MCHSSSNNSEITFIMLHFLNLIFPEHNWFCFYRSQFVMHIIFKFSLHLVVISLSCAPTLVFIIEVTSVIFNVVNRTMH